MGFLSNMKNQLTGSWADVHVRVPQATRGQPVPVAVDVQVRDQDIQIQAVVVEVRCTEMVSLNGVQLMGDHDADPVHGTAREELFSQQFVIAQGQQLTAGTGGSFDGQVQLPLHLPPSTRGRNAEFRWLVRGRLDMKGNDPDSGWQQLQVD